MSEEAKKVPTQDELKDWLRPVEDPELFMSIVDLGLVYEIHLDNGQCKVIMTLTSPMCPMGDYIVEEVTKRMKEHELVNEVEVEMTFEPKWDPAEMASDECKDQLGIWQVFCATDIFYTFGYSENCEYNNELQ